MRYLRLPVRVWNGDCLSCKLLSTAWCWRVARTCWRPTRCQSSEFQSNWSANWLILDFHSKVSTRVTRDLVVSRCPQTELCIELCVEHSVVPADLKCYNCSSLNCCPQKLAMDVEMQSDWALDKLPVVTTINSRLVSSWHPIRSLILVEISCEGEFWIWVRITDLDNLISTFHFRHFLKGGKASIPILALKTN